MKSRIDSTRALVEAMGRAAKPPRVLLRTGLALTPRGGALAKMLPAFKAGAGGPLGHGKQLMSWVSIEDVLGAIEHALHTDALSGPVNLVAPAPLTCDAFAKELGRVPTFALELLYGESARAALLASQRVLPKRLAESGFQFLHASLDPALRFLLGLRLPESLGRRPPSS